MSRNSLTVNPSYIALKISHMGIDWMKHLLEVFDRLFESGKSSVNGCVYSTFIDLFGNLPKKNSFMR